MYYIPIFLYTYTYYIIYRPTYYFFTYNIQNIKVYINIHKLGINYK